MHAFVMGDEFCWLNAAILGFGSFWFGSFWFGYFWFGNFWLGHFWFGYFWQLSNLDPLPIFVSLSSTDKSLLKSKIFMILKNTVVEFKWWSLLSLFSFFVQRNYGMEASGEKQSNLRLSPDFDVAVCTDFYKRKEHGSDLILSYDNSYFLLLPALHHLISTQSILLRFPFCNFPFGKNMCQLYHQHWINIILPKFKDLFKRKEICVRCIVKRNLCQYDIIWPIDWFLFLSQVWEHDWQ